MRQVKIFAHVKNGVAVWSGGLCQRDDQDVAAPANDDSKELLVVIKSDCSRSFFDAAGQQLSSWTFKRSASVSWPFQAYFLLC